jgi:hypothetical protein
MIMKKVFYLLFISVFVIAAIFTASLALASQSYFSVRGTNPSMQYGVRASQPTNSVNIACGSVNYSFVELKQLDGNFICNGYYQRNSGYIQQPEYYYEYLLNGLRVLMPVGNAPVGQTHTYGVYLDTQYYGQATAVAFRDYNTLLSVQGFSDDAGEVYAQSESRNSGNGMNYHFHNVNYASQGLYWYPFNGTELMASYPYYYIKYSNTDWAAKRYQTAGATSNTSNEEINTSAQEPQWHHSSFPLPGKAVTLSEAEKELPFKVILPSNMGRPSLIKLVKSQNFLYVVYTKDRSYTPPDSDLYKLIQSGAIVLMEYPNKYGEKAVDTVEGIIKAGEQLNSNASLPRNSIEKRITINGHPAAIGGNVMHCLYWFNDTTNFKLNASVTTPLSRITDIAKSMYEQDKTGS